MKKKYLASTGCEINGKVESEKFPCYIGNISRKYGCKEIERSGSMGNYRDRGGQQGLGELQGPGQLQGLGKQLGHHHLHLSNLPSVHLHCGENNITFFSTLVLHLHHKAVQNVPI